MGENLSNSLNDYAGLFTILALLISALSLRVAIKALSLKCGNKVVGYYNVASSIESTMPYIHKIMLQNLKDKDVVILEMYIRFGRNVFIDMFSKGLYDDFIQILPPLGTLNFTFGPSYMNSCGTNMVDLSKLLRGVKRGTIILSTNQGKIIVKPITKRWSVVADYFKNYGTQHILLHKIYTQKSVCRDGLLSHKAIDFSSYGDAVKYLVTLKIHGKDIEYKVFKETDYQVQKFSNIQFTKQSLLSAQSLRKFLNTEKKKGHIQYDCIVDISELDDFIEKERKNEDGSYEAKAEGWFEYYIVDRIQTIWWNIKADIKCFNQNNNNYDYYLSLFRFLISFKK